MSDKGTPHNIGQAFFESLGKGLSALPGILEQERQKQMQNLQLQMEQERHAINVENAQIGLEKSRAGMSEYIRRASLSLQEKAVEDAQAEAQAEEAAVRVGLESLLQGTPIGGIVESAESAGIDPGIGQLQDILGAQGVDTSFSIGGVDFAQRQEEVPFNIEDVLPAGFEESKITHDPTTKKTTITYKREITEQVDSGVLIQNAQEEADKRGLVIDRVNLDDNGRIKSISLKQPTAEGVETDANQRARLKEEDRRAQDTIISEANAIFQAVPQEIREKIDVAVITNINDLKKVLVEKKVRGVKTFLGIDLLSADNPELAEAHKQLIALANRYTGIGGTAESQKADINTALGLLGE